MIDIDISEKISIIGQSGSGKTTLMEYFLKILPYRMIVIDTVGRFSKVVHIGYKGYIQSDKNKSFWKITNDSQLESIIKTINRTVGPVYLVVDEIDQYTDTHVMLRETSLYMQQGRNYQHGGMFSVRQIGRLNKEIFTNSRYIFLFSTHNKNDILYLQQSLPFNIGEMIYNLDVYQFYIIDSFRSDVIGKFILQGNNLKLIE